MRRMLVTSSALALLVSFLVPVYAQDSKSARGTVTAIAGDTITVKAGTEELKLMVDAKTMVVAEGGGTADRAAAAKGAPGPKLTELLKVGEAVEVSYREAGGALHATSVRRVRSPGAGGGSVSAAKSETATGTVTAVSTSSLAITGSASGGATFTQTYTIDTNTLVVGAGAGTASTKGKVTITELVKIGDRVIVTFEPSGTTVHATEVRVRTP